MSVKTKKVLSVAFVVILVTGSWLIFKRNEDGTSLISNEKSSGKPSLKNSPSGSDDGSHENNPRVRPVVEASVPFEKLDQRAKFQSLTGRISHIKEDLENSSDPASLVGKIMSDMRKLDSFGRSTIFGTLENELASLDSESPNKFEWFARTYPKIRKQLQDFTFNGKSSELHVFSLMASNAKSMGVDVYTEVKKLDNPEAQKSLIEGVIPQMIIQSNDSFQEIVDGLQPDVKAQVQQNVMITSAIDKMYRSEALEMYLGNMGTSGNHSEIVSKWFVDSPWFWQNSSRIADVAAKSQPGPRRDLVIAEIIRATSKSDPESGKQWLPLISDQKLADQLSKTVLIQK